MACTAIQDAVLSRLLPNPIAIRENGLAGRLFVDGNLDGNCLLFRFLFDEPEEIVPVFLEISIAGKYYRYLLSGRDLTNPMVKSPVLTPDTAITEGLEILSVSPLISVSEKTNASKGAQSIKEVSNGNKKSRKDNGIDHWVRSVKRYDSRRRNGDK
jgi:hypothetical protein